MKQIIIQMEHNKVKNPNWQDSNQLAEFLLHLLQVDLS